MFEKIKKHQWTLLISLIVVCVGIVIASGLYYVEMLRKNLQNNAIQNVMTVIRQQQQAFDTFIEEDRRQVHRFAEFFAQHDLVPENIQTLLDLTDDEDNSVYLVMCLEEGWVCGTSFSDIRQLNDENLAMFRSFEGSGVRDAYTGLYSGTSRFGYYETFHFESGHIGLVQKSYNRNEVRDTLSLSFYNDEGLSHVVNQDGSILLRPASITENFYESIFDALSDNYGQQDKVDQFMEELHSRKAGSMIFERSSGELVYTHVPLESVEGWSLVSVVPMNIITAETDELLHTTQMTVGFFLLMVVICAVLALLIWRSHKNIAAKEDEVAYHSQLFDIFTTYLAHNTDDMYMMLDQETEELEYVSPNVERVLGVGKEDVIPFLAASDLSIDPQAAQAYYDELNALKPGQAGTPRNMERINPKTGERKYFHENAYCADVHGRTKRVVYISDRTHERMTHDSLTEALRMARAASDAKTAFLGSVSHDIRTPMNAIIGFLALMRDEADNPAMVREYAQRIDAASQHLLGLINDVLDMNKIESGSATLNITEVDLAEIVEEINTIIRPQTKDKDQTFDIFVSHLNYEHLLADKLRINQILINLLSNAVKYTPKGGSIQVRLEELDQVVPNYSRIRFTVSDNGLGMSKDYLKVIFDPFTREETTATREIQGTGLGMAITKSLVDLMGGTIKVESELGKGSTFTVELELRIQEREVQEEEPEFWDEHSVTRMIVADDDEDACRNIVKAMAKTGVNTDYATDGQAAVQMMRSAREAGKPYDLILLDWMMPNLDGLETARLIRKNYPDKIPILLLTAYDWGDIEEEAMEIGVTHFMPKPFFMSTFKDAIRRVMGSQKKEEDSGADVVRGKHILVVDDIEVNRIILVKILNTLGADCDTATNGHEAVLKFESSRPGEYDLILMDVQMPVMNGYEATRAIRGGGHLWAKRIPIIAMTANAFVDDVRDAIESGMNAHIAKPVQMDKLKSTIQQVLDSQEALAGNRK